MVFVQGILLEKEFPVLKNDNKRKQVWSIKVKTLEEFDELQFVELLKKAIKLLEKSKKAWFL